MVDSMGATHSQLLGTYSPMIRLIALVTGIGYQFRYEFVLCIVSGYKFRRLVCPVSLCYVLF